MIVERLLNKQSLKDICSEGQGEPGRRGSGFRSERGGGVPVVLSGVATAAGKAPGAHQGRGEPGRRGSRFRSLWVVVGPSCALEGPHCGWECTASAAGAGRTRAARGGGRLQAGVGEGYPEKQKQTNKTKQKDICSS